MDGEKLTIEAYRKAHECYIRLLGSLTFAGCQVLFEDVIRTVAREDEKLIVGLKHLEFVDSAGLGTLIRINGQMKRENRELVFIEPNTQVYKLMTLAKVDLVIPIKPGPNGQKIREELEKPAYQLFAERSVGADRDEKVEAA